MSIGITADGVLKENDIPTTLSSRLVFALNALGVTQAELARMVGIKPQAIHYLCSSHSTKSRFTYEIADSLNINSLWLATGTGTMQLQEEPDIHSSESPKRLPILDWKQIELLAAQKNQMENIPTQNNDRVITNSEVGRNGFAFKLSDKSMYPRFEQDTIVIINPHRTPKNKDFVLAYLEIGGVVFRQYEIENNQTYLKPVNTTMYKTITTGTTDLIIGVMVEARWIC